MTTPEAPTTSPAAEPKKAGIWGSALWALGLVAGLPLFGALLWALGRGATSARGLFDRIGVTWNHVWIGLAVLVAYAILVTVIHTVRTSRARSARNAAIVNRGLV